MDSKTQPPLTPSSPTSAVGKRNIGQLFASKKNRILLGIGILSLIVLAQLFWVFRTFVAEEGVLAPQKEVHIFPMSDASIALVPTKSSYVVGETVPVAIKVITGGRPSDNIDVVVRYDPQILDAPPANFIQLGRLYEEYPVAGFDNNRGIVRISGSSMQSAASFYGIGQLATLNFAAKAAGNPSLIIEFEKVGATADSNVVLTGTARDVLSHVINPKLSVVTTASAAEPSSQSCDGYYQYCETTDKKTGKQFCKQGVIKDNLCSFDPLLTVSCGECDVQ